MPPLQRKFLDRIATPLLAGANYKGRIAACLGALVGIAATALASSLLGLPSQVLPVLVAPIGASAVLVFVVPSSPLAQPWPIFGGNLISTMVGMEIARLVSEPYLAAGIAVAAAILLMSLFRCLHPPGGACALLAVVGGPSVQAAGHVFAFVPVGSTSALLVLCGWLFHRVSGHSYPHRAVPVVGHSITIAADPRFRPEDIDAALDELGETFDVSREDLDLLFRLAERHASKRRAGQF